MEPANLLNQNPPKAMLIVDGSYFETMLKKRHYNKRFNKQEFERLLKHLE